MPRDLCWERGGRGGVRVPWPPFRISLEPALHDIDDGAISSCTVPTAPPPLLSPPNPQDYFRDPCEIRPSSLNPPNSSSFPFPPLPPLLSAYSPPSPPTLSSTIPYSYSLTRLFQLTVGVSSCSREYVRSSSLAVHPDMLL